MVLESLKTEAVSEISVRLLGGFDVVFDKQLLQPLPRRSACLLAYLIFYKGRPQTRDLLAGRFWADQPDDVARKRLSNALWKVRSAARQEFGFDLIESNSNSVQIASEIPITVDVEIFEQTFDRYDKQISKKSQSEAVQVLEPLLDLYKGDLLAGYYDDWISIERQRLKARFQLVLQRLISLNKSLTNYELALQFSQDLLATDHLNESFHQEIIRLYGLLGRTSDVHRQLAICTKILDEELGIQPSTETVQLVSRLREKPDLTFESSKDSFEFVGRTDEKNSLFQAIDLLETGTGSVAIIEGEPGIGKTCLMQELSEAANWRGATVITGDHKSIDRLHPYSGIRKALQPFISGLRGEHLAEVVDPVWFRQISEIFPSVSASGHLSPSGFGEKLNPAEESWRRSEALAQIILAQGTISPTVFILENLHHCDKDSLKVLEHLLPRISESRILLCLTYRREEAQKSELAWSTLVRADKTQQSHRLILEPFTASEVRFLAEKKFPHRTISEIEMSTLMRETRGLPLLVQEALQQQNNLEDFSFPIQDFASGSIGAFSHLIEQRLQLLDPEIRASVEVLAIADHVLSSTQVAQILGIERREAIVQLVAGVKSGLVVETSLGCEIISDQVSASIYQQIDGKRRLLLHKRFLEIYVDLANIRPETAAYHAGKAEEWKIAHFWHRKAANFALSINAYHTCIEHFKLADEAALQRGIYEEERIDDLLKLEEVFGIIGNRESQKKILDLLDSMSLDVASSLRVRQRNAWYLALSDNLDEAVELARKGAAVAARLRLPEGDFFYTAGSAYLWGGKPAKAIDFFSKAVAAKESIGASAIMERIMLGKSLIEQQEFTMGRTQLEAVLHEAEVVGDIRAQVEALGHLSVASLAQGNSGKAENNFLKALELSQKIAYRHGEGLTMVNLAALYVLLGRGMKALDIFNQAGSVFLSLQSARGEAFVKVNAAELNHKLLGDDEQAKNQATEAAIYFRSVGDQVHECVALNTLCNIDRRQGRRQFARRRLREVLRKTKRSQAHMAESAAYYCMGLLDFDEKKYVLSLEHFDASIDLLNSFSFDPLLPVVFAAKARSLLQNNSKSEAFLLASKASGLIDSGSQDAAFAAWLCAEVFLSTGDSPLAKKQALRAFDLLRSNLVVTDDPISKNSEALPKSWKKVPENKAILEMHDKFFARKTTSLLPRLGVAMGRKLRDEDFIHVDWTVSDPSDYLRSSTQQIRHSRIERLCLQALDQGAVARILDLAEVLEVSSRTIKRDLNELRQQGIQVRTRGFL